MLEKGYKMQATELFSFSLSSPITYMFFFLAMMTLISVIPAVDGETLYYLIRSNRTKWFTGQCLYVLLIAVIYMAWLFFCFLVAIKWQVTFDNEWSDSVLLVSETGIVQDIGININIWFSYEIVQNYTPFSMFFTVVFVQTFLIFLIASLFMELRFLGCKRIAYVIIIFLWAESFMFQQLDVRPVWWKLCPVGESMPSFWDYGYLKGAPTFKFVIIEYIALAVILLLFARKHMKYFDFGGAEMMMEGDSI